MRIHLGHHFYGAGNLGDDFMLAGFFAALRTLLDRRTPAATFTGSVPFALDALRKRFPQVEWLPYERPARERAIRECDVWLGLGGSPFQHALSRWFLDHLVEEAALCAREAKPMFFLGVGVQSRQELAAPEVRRLCAQAEAIWTRDAASAGHLAALPAPPPVVESAADLAHVFFRDAAPPAARAGRLTFVPNFDYGTWPALDALLQVAHRLTTGAANGDPGSPPSREATAGAASRVSFNERVWLAQESRELPGAERALYAALSSAERKRWQLVAPDLPGQPLHAALARWPSGEWLVTARYHAALAGAWARSKIVVIATNEKLRAVAHELHCPTLHAESTADDIARAFEAAEAATPPTFLADKAFAACASFVRAASVHVARR